MPNSGQGSLPRLPPLRTTALWLLAAGVLAAGSPAGADWIVTRDGARVETKGAWTVKGKLVVFTLPAGALSSLRLETVDLEASRRATAEALAPPAEAAEKEAPAAEKQAPRRVLTDKDFAHSDPATSTSTPGVEGAAAGQPAAPAAGLQVMSWDQVVDANRNTVEITGSLRNGGSNYASALSLDVKLVDREGAALASKAAAISVQGLSPGESARFQVVFPGGIAFETVKFEVNSVALEPRQPAPASDAPGTTPDTEPPPADPQPPPTPS